MSLEIHINGKKQCTAGFDGTGVVSAMLPCVRRAANRRNLREQEVTLDVGELDSARHEFVKWLQGCELRPGDEVLLRIVDGGGIDVPLEGSRKPQDDAQEPDKAYVLRMA